MAFCQIWFSNLLNVALVANICTIGWRNSPKLCHISAIYCQTYKLHEKWMMMAMTWVGYMTAIVHSESKMYVIEFHPVWLIGTYSSVPNRRACTFINFEKKFPPARPYLGLHVYCFWKKNPPARLFFLHFYWYLPCKFINLRKKFPLHGLIWVCTFNVF